MISEPPVQDQLLAELTEALAATFGTTGWSESAIIEVAMAQAVQPGSDGLIAAAVTLRLLALSDTTPSSIPGRHTASTGDVNLWRRLSARLDRGAWFRSAGPEAKALYDAAMARLLHTGGPTLRDVLNEIAALPAPATVAGVIDFACGFFDSLETAEQRLRAHLERPLRRR